MKPSTNLSRLLAVLLAFAMLATACGGSDDADESAEDTPAAEDAAAADESAEDTSADDEPEPEPEDPGNAADDSADPVKIGLIAQDEELFAFPEVRAVAQAMVDFYNAEEGGIDGHPIELDVCGAGDSPESHVACAQQFANDDGVHVVINAGFGGNSAASNPLLSDAGKATMTLGNDFPDYLTPGIFAFDPGLLGLAQVFFVYAADTRGVSTATLFIADDPSLTPFIPVLELIAADNGIEINEVVPLGFEPDLTGPISAANTDNEAWLMVLGDGAQCTAAASAVDTVGYEGQLFANDLCMSEDIIASGDLDGWAGPIVSSAPTADGGAEVDEIVRILDTYGDSDAQRAGLAGWALAQVTIARDVLIEGGNADADDASVLAALGSYSSTDILGFPDVSCPSPSAFAGACNNAPLMVTVVDGEMTQPDGFVYLDFAELEFLLEG